MPVVKILSKFVDRASGWIIVAFGAIHCAYTFRLYRGISTAALWFFGTGLALLYAGGLNILRIRLAKPELRWFSFLANVLLLTLTVSYAAQRPLARAVKDPFLIAPIAALGLSTWFSARRH